MGRLDRLFLAVRHLNSNIEVYTQSIEFFEGYSGPYFRPSVEKFRMAFGAAPLNLHVQFFQIDGKPAGYFLTSGASAAVPLRFTVDFLCLMYLCLAWRVVSIEVVVALDYGPHPTRSHS